MPAGDLQIGELFRTRSGETVTFESVCFKPGEHPVYNLEVEQEHHFYVGKSGVLVHNEYGLTTNRANMPLEEAIENGELSVAGARQNPQHHVFPQEETDWFEARGVGIDDYAVNLYEGEHQGLHGGGNWRLGRQAWEGEWNNEIMNRLIDAEADQIAAGGSQLTPNQIEVIGRKMMSDYGIGNMPFVKYQKGWWPQ